ncbi:MAG TPA: helical backbone metal receptor, partial [Pyrinomonadaceae bacterium]|nr:helical backbone metal receptor [Pyrinomonadaceae bacterium]
GAGGKLVGVTSFCNYPAAAREITKIGDTMNPNLEAIIAQKPQVVFVSTDSQIENFTRRMQEQNIAVFVTDAKNLEGVLQNIKQIGDVLGTTEQAEKLIADLQERIGEIESKVKDKKPPKVFVQISNSPIYTIGKDSFITDLVHRAGGVSLTENIPTAYPNLSKETALAFEPEAIILSESPDNQEPNEAFKNSPAVKNKRVYKINADLLSRPSPRIVDALEEMARALHAESFE